MDLQKLKSALPQGAINTIAEREGVVLSTVHNAFNPNKKQTAKHLSIINTAIEYLKEFRQKQADTEKAFQEVI